MGQISATFVFYANKNKNILFIKENIRGLPVCIS
jgi:hypothetical protein